MTKIGDLVPAKSIKKGVPPLVFQIQPTGYILLKKPEELRQWEEDIKKFHGVSLKATDVLAAETCSGGCSDACDVAN